MTLNFVLTFKMVACPKPEKQFRDLNPADVDEMVLCCPCWLLADTNTTKLLSDWPTPSEGGQGERLVMLRHLCTTAKFVAKRFRVLFELFLDFSNLDFGREKMGGLGRGVVLCA